ncbi:MAG: sugar ABC transporter permease [Clostridia bacterium]|nr:sugar ABC transporter permease [Clostridia bacterium]MBR4441899.1 sugar ABC transporter permease [Clostridia bacterium]
MLSKQIKRYRQHWQLYVFLILPVAYILIFAYWPMFGLQIAFKKFNIVQGIWGSPWVGFKNFIKFFNAYQFQAVIVNTLTLSIYALLAAFPFPIMFALVLNVVEHNKLKKVVQTITYMPHFISTVVLVGMLMQIFHPMIGLYGKAYQALTGNMASDLFAKPAAFKHLYVWSGVWQGFGYNSIIYIAALTNVSAELHEAAEVDGASRFQRVIHIDFPALVPTIVIMLILRMGSIMSIGFEKTYLMQNSLNLSASEIISTFVYKKGLGAGVGNDYSYSTAIGMFNSVVNLILITTVNMISRRVSETSLW